MRYECEMLRFADVRLQWARCARAVRYERYEMVQASAARDVAVQDGAVQDVAVQDVAVQDVVYDGVFDMVDNTLVHIFSSSTRLYVGMRLAAQNVDDDWSGALRSDTVMRC